ncbi:unnamed protein product [Arctogadus glacialis]
MDPVVARRVFVQVAGALVHRRGKHVHRRWWVHPILRTRNQSITHLCRSCVWMLSYSISIFGCLRTSSTSCLARYLATGDSFHTIGFSYRVGTSSVCRIVREVASAIWTALVEEGGLEHHGRAVLSGAGTSPTASERLMGSKLQVTLAPCITITRAPFPWSSSP